jgi:hypothetical protein
MKTYISIAVLVALTACMGPVVDETQSARTQMVGMSKADLVACAGPPTGEHYSAGVQKMTYVRTEGKGKAERSCRADFAVYRDHVAHVTYVGLVQSKSGPPSPCVNIVNACLK